MVLMDGLLRAELLQRELRFQLLHQKTQLRVRQSQCVALQLGGETPKWGGSEVRAEVRGTEDTICPIPGFFLGKILLSIAEQAVVEPAKSLANARNGYPNTIPLRYPHGRQHLNLRDKRQPGRS